MEPVRERRKHQRQDVLLPLRVTEGGVTGKLLYQGNTVNVSAGGVYFKTLNWQELRVGTRVHVVIDVPPELFRRLPFGGMTGTAEVVRVERGSRSPDSLNGDGASLPGQGGVAIRMTSRLRFDPELHLPRFDRDQPKTV
jgi:hypothetical protein